MPGKDWLLRFGLFTLLSAGAFVTPVVPTGASPAQAFPLRVLVEGPSARLRIAVSQPSILRENNGQEMPLKPGAVVEIDAQRLGSLEAPESGMTLVGDRWYPGAMVFGWLRGGVVAINYVDSETYLRGVVPREMPENFHPEALKAQAIAARTYALTSWRRRKHGPYYDLVDTTVDQVYGGFARYNPRTGQSRWLIDPRTDRAVAETTGLVLDYSQVDGNYRNWAIGGWRGNIPLPKGRMLSQEGSQKLATAGWRFEQILWHWYRTPVFQLPVGL